MLFVVTQYLWTILKKKIQNILALHFLKVMLPTNQCWLLIQPQLPQPCPLFITCCFRAEEHGIHAVMLDIVGGHPRLWCAHHAQAVQTLVVLRP